MGVAVVVSVAVVSVAGSDVGGVEQNRHVLVAVLVVVFLDVGKLVFLQESGAHDEEGHVGEAVDHLGVGDDFDGRAVEDDEVVAVAQRGDEPVEPLAREELGGVGGHGADADGVERGCAVDAAHEERLFAGLADDEVDDAVVGAADELRQRTFADVEVDDEHALAFDGEHLGEVDRDEGLAAAGIGGGDGHHAASVSVGIAVGSAEVFEVGAQHAEGFVDDVAAPLGDDNLALLLLLLAEARQAVRFVVGEGYLAEVGDLELGEVFLAADLGVEALANHEDADGDGESEQEGDHQDVALLGEGGGVVAVRLFDHAGVVGGEGLGELVLLALLE